MCKPDGTKENKSHIKKKGVHKSATPPAKQVDAVSNNQKIQ